VTITWKICEEFASESYAIVPIYLLYTFSACMIYIYIRMLYIVLLFRNLLCFSALSRRNRYIILGLLPDLLLEQRSRLYPPPPPPPPPTHRCRLLLFCKGFPKSPRDTCPTFLSAAAVEPADEIHYSGRSIVVEFNLNWRFLSTRRVRTLCTRIIIIKYVYNNGTYAFRRFVRCTRAIVYYVILFVYSFLAAVVVVRHTFY